MSDKKSGKKGQPRPPRGVHHVITDEIVTALTRLLDRQEMTTGKLSDAYKARYGYRPSPSSWTKIKARTSPTSKLVYNLAEMYGWPRPPVADTDPALAEAQAKLERIFRENRDMFEALNRKADGYISVLRDLQEITTDDESGSSE